MLEQRPADGQNERIVVYQTLVGLAPVDFEKLYTLYLDEAARTAVPMNGGQAKRALGAHQPLQRVGAKSWSTRRRDLSSGSKSRSVPYPAVRSGPVDRRGCLGAGFGRGSQLEGEGIQAMDDPRD